MKILLILIAAAALVAACSSTQNIIRPKGNIKAINTANDDFAPVQKPLKADECGSCTSEFSANKQKNDDGVHTSKFRLAELLDFNYSLEPEALTYINDESGFFAVSHPPDVESSEKLDLVAAGIIGGTDLFEFRFINGRYLFQNLGKPINSVFWDSHPAVVSDDNCNQLLIWSSDRNDQGGYASPFTRIVDENAKNDSASYSGNTDLFYCFRENGKWGEVNNLAGINSDLNEETPYIYCMCNNPTLLFASNRAGNYDIYKAKLKVDFVKQTIIVEEIPTPLSGSDINSPDKEFFPFVAAPLAEEGPDNRLYFSSNRFKDPVHVTQDSVKQSFGGFDIYSFPLPADLNCDAPKIYYDVRLINAENPFDSIRSPYAIQFNTNNTKIDELSGSHILREGFNYKVSGGSVYDNIECIEGLDKTISHYSVRHIKELEPKVIKIDSTIHYTELTEKIISIKRDTSRSAITIHKDGLLTLKNQPGRKVENMIILGDSVTIKYFDIKEDIKTELVEEKKSKKIAIQRVIPQWDTSFVKIGDKLAISEKTKRDGGILYKDINDDIYVLDTIYLWPQYYIYPPCEWKYEKEEIEYSKNVPYFQTCFWEVNTTENFNRHIKLIRSGKYADASFIELHSKNQYFGYRRDDLSDAQKEFRKQKNENRKWEYYDYAGKVDKNLTEMAREISDEIIPIFRQYDEHAGGVQNKLLISINAYSDIRPVLRGVYLGEETVQYLAAAYDSSANAIINFANIRIESGASLEDTLNDYLSKLRAFFGYKEILKRLLDNDNFKHYFDNGFVFNPQESDSKADFDRKFDKAKIIFLVEGRKVDENVKAKKMGYVGEAGDYKTYDPVRRIDVNIKRVEWVGGELKRPDCCKPQK